MIGHLRGRLEAAAREELAALTEGYRRGLVPIVVPLSDDPQPRELMLRTRV